MLLEMEPHSGLVSLNMSPFRISPQQSSPQDAVGGGNPQNTIQQQQQQQQSHPHQQQYNSPSGYSPATGSNVCHLQQNGQQQQQQAANSGGTNNSAAMAGFEGAFFDSSNLEERCPMCGDKMTGYQQYGLLTCETCKGFFKRNNISSCSNKKVYTCLFSPPGGGGGGGGGAAGNGNNNNNNNNNNSHSNQNNNSNGAYSGNSNDAMNGMRSVSSANSNNNGSGNNNNNNGSGVNNTSSSTGGASNLVGSMCHPAHLTQPPSSHHQQQTLQQQQQQQQAQVTGVGVVTGSIPGPSEFPDTKEIIEELCPVCGDKVSGYHYGLLTCESCKGFFKRTVQNKKVYTCVAERSCHIDKTQRKRCPFCRFQKCLEVGMKLEAVRADRMRGGRNKFGPMYKRDRARKLQMMRQRQLALQTIRGNLGDPSNYSSTVAPFLHIKQEIQIPQVSSLTSSPDSSPSPAAVAATLVTTQAGSISGANQNQMVAPSTQNSLTSNNMHGAGTGSNSLDGGKLWAANSTTSSPKGFGGFEHHVGGGGAGQLVHLAGLSGPHPSQAGGPQPQNIQVSYKTSTIIQDLIQSIDDREWQTSLYNLLQNQTYNQCEVDLFELMCKVLDQNLFSQVDWARNSVFFKDLKVDDQMKLLQHSWSDMLVLDHLHQRLHNNLPDETTLPNGQKFDLLCLGLLGVPSLAELFNRISHQLQELKFDISDYICMKFIMLLNHEVRGLVNKRVVQEGHEQVQTTLMEYSLGTYPSIPDKFHSLMKIIPAIREVASRGEDHLYQKHCTGGAPTQTLLMEMLHAKRK